MTDLKDRVKLVRKKLGLNNQQGLADILKCNVGKIKGIEQGATKSLKRTDIILLSENYGFSDDWLESGTGPMFINENEELLKNVQQISNMLDNNITIPFYSEINASAGHGCINGECEATNITISKDMLPSFSTKIEAIRVSGNSMTPTIEDEDIVFIDKNQTDPINGKIYVVYLCEEVYIKRLFIEPKTKDIILNSDNPIFPQLKADCEDFRIIGLVTANMHISKL
ncbi:MAG: S24 family peptidase [Sulfurimonas sp.]|nr:S24 family peptidase [Sulfurimonas sp.]